MGVRKPTSPTGGRRYGAFFQRAVKSLNSITLHTGGGDLFIDYTYFIGALIERIAELLLAGHRSDRRY